MNEKIKQLAIKSWLVSEHKGKLLSCYREDVDLTKYLEDFAELIVQECIDYCGENLSKTVAGALKTHFGVQV